MFDGSVCYVGQLKFGINMGYYQVMFKYKWVEGKNGGMLKEKGNNVEIILRMEILIK